MDPLSYKHILFDADNTLLDFDMTARSAFDLTFKMLGLIPTPADYEEYKDINRSVWRAFELNQIGKEELILRRWMLSLRPFGLENKALEANSFFLNRLIDCSKLIPGAREVLAELVQIGCILTLITNGFKEVQRPRIEKLGIANFFYTIVVSDEIGVSKPDIKFFDYVLRMLKYPDLESILVVGDNLHSDIEGANRVGIDSCWYNPEKIANEEDIIPQYEVSNYDELIQLIKNKRAG